MYRDHDMASEAATTRDKLLDAAAKLFAERGVNNVSLAEIVRAAGQRNASAIHYHFGSRDEVLRAILERHVPVIRERRVELLELAATRDEARSAAEALVRPVTEFAQLGWRERAYLQIGSELTSYLDRATPSIQRLLRETAGHDAMALLRERCPPVPNDIWNERTAIATAFLGRAAADRARLLESRSRERQNALPDEEFVENLVDMFLGAITSPVSVRTAGRVTGG
jgi:AcrR family transcriptional regulator